MRIIRVTLDGVGKFGTLTQIAGFGTGVNILAAGNEAGKSTMFRAVRACLFERHNTKNEFIRNLVTDGASLPITVTLDFEHQDHTYAVTKSFVKSPAASLVRDGKEIARGREADEMVWEILGIAPGGGRSVDEAAFGLLWVGQGQSLHVPSPSEAATTTLNAAIQAEVGTLVGGERARTVLSALKADLAQLVTDTGRPKAGGSLATATARSESLEIDVTDADRKLSILDIQFIELAARRAERSRLGDSSLLTQMSGDLSAAQQELKTGEAAAGLLSQFEAVEQRTATSLDRSERHLAELEERRTRIDEDRIRGGQLREQLIPIEEQDAAARTTMRQARDKIAEIDTGADKEEEKERSLKRLEDAATRATARPSLVVQQQILEELEQRIIKNSAGLSGNRVTAAVMTSYDEVERELSVLQARMEAAASEVSIELNDGGVGQVTIDGTLVVTNVVQRVTDHLTICLGDLATVTVSPPALANTQDQKKRVQSQAELAKLLEDVGAATPSELRTARASRQALEADFAGLNAEIAALGIRDSTAALAIEQIKTDIEAIDTLVTAVLEHAKLEVLPTGGDISLRQDELRQGREASRRQRQAFEGAIEAQNAILSELANTRGRLNGALSEIQKRLDGDLAILPDETRIQIIADAGTAVGDLRADHRTKAAALEELRLKAPSHEDLERIRIRIERLQSALEGQNARIGSLDKTIANLEGQIQNAGGEGVGEKVLAMREEQELVSREVEKLQERVATSTLLKDTIDSCYKEQRDRLHAPLLRHLQPFLNDVFPSAEIELGDGFSVTGIRRSGPAAETFERLSAGTQEQIAVLVRLAMGALISERGQSVPIILDDALVFSDDDRIEQMFDALSRAGKNQQVIVLTCRTRTFSALGGRQMTISSK